MVKKRVLEISFLVSVMLVMIILASSFALASTTNFYPSSGKDTTNGSYSMSPSDLSKVNVSDDIRYITQGSWNKVYYDEYVEWAFSPNINSRSAIEDVKLTFEWQREPYVDAISRIQVFVDNELINTIYLNNPTTDKDQIDVLSLSEINTVEEVNNLKIRFQTTDIYSRKTKHDLVKLTVQYILDNTAPTCSIDFLEQKDNHHKFYLSSPYINEDGKFYVNGNAADTQSAITNEQYNRKSPDYFHEEENAIPTDGAFDELIEDWHSQDWEPVFIEGNHTICCRGTDKAINTGEWTCTTFCIDKQVPIMDSVSDNTKDCSSEGKYWNQNSIDFSWTAHDNGCAGVDYYIVKLYKNGELIGTQPTSSTGWTASSLADGKSYYITVTPVDKAGNEGAYMASDVIEIDLTNPTVEITTDDSKWYTNDFLLEENDSDKNPFDAEIRIVDYDEETLAWTSIGWDGNYNVQIPEQCSTQGANCHVYKRAQDKACNYGYADKTFKIDTEAPLVNKEVGEPKVQGFEWMQKIIDWFVTDETKITLSCDDGDGSDVKSIYYKINDGNWTLYTEPFALGEDGVKSIEYYCIDNVDKESEHKFETDKVDTLAPETTKTIGEPKYWNGSALWVNNYTLFTLSCLDTEVGCNKTYYEIDEYGEQTYSSPFTFGSDDYNDGEHTIYYHSADLLGNLEQKKNEIDWLDTTAPLIQILNPTEEEAGSIERCVQSIVAIVNDDGSGVKKVWAELWNSTDKIKEANMSKTVSGTYQALMDKQLPAGEYLLKVYAEDNLGNSNEMAIEEMLKPGVFVEYIEDPICQINPEIGGNCDFTFHICTRNSNAVSMKMKKLAEVVTPEMMDAKISKENETAFVYLWDPAITDIDILKLSDEIINGRTDFTLSLDVPSDVASMIGVGAHKLDYLIESYSN